jgi:hypothetical protein
MSGNWNGTVRAERYTCTGDLIALSGRVKSRNVIIVDERNEGNTGSGGRLHYGGSRLGSEVLTLTTGSS